MKRIIYIILFFALSFVAYAQDSTGVVIDDIKEVAVSENIKSDNDSVQTAIEAYNEGDYYTCIGILEREIKRAKQENLESAYLHYNLGNAYFRVNELGYARLNYERAALIDPGDRDIRHNIDYVMTRIEDKILEVDTLFISSWFNAVQNLLGTNTWAIIGVCLFLLFMLCLVAFFFSKQIFIKKASFYAGIVLLVFILFTNIFAYRQKQKLVHRDAAVIMAATVSVVSSPDINSKELFRLHVGTKVKITKDDRSWLEIELDNGSVGWIQRDKLEII